ncbi:cytochrome C oxidase subunit IV family protein [Methylobacterium sp. GC_Met_2]|uniref:cytochrome o ubiquinol oxidase subunit IV n=1 Tax=Methylobacterium sp. GC_Met_2 TaxID=2937376 RepID=UPI00226B1447|nr:cytochrome C oxidase subunit IV family protein [Methylobacterium sp. GC_Met_2]
MNARDQFRGIVLLKAIGAAALLGSVRVLTGGPNRRSGGLRDDRSQVADERHSRRDDLRTYAVGYVLALLLTGAAFAVVTWRWAAGATALGIILALALLQAVVHFRYFLHVDLRRSARDDLQLILFSSLIVCLMVGGTLVVLLNLRMRMM